MDLVILICLVAEVVALSRVDNKLYGTWCTPFSLLAYPYVTIVLSAYFVGSSLDFVPLYAPSVLIWIVGLFVVWIVGSFLGWGIFDLRDPGGQSSLRVVPDGEKGSEKFAMRIAWILVPVLLLDLTRSMNAVGGWPQVGTEEFKIAFAHGWYSHALVLASPILILLIGTARRDKPLQWLTIGILFVFFMIAQVKGSVLQQLFAGLFYRTYRGKFHLSFRKVLVGVVAIYLIFNSIYLFGAMSTDPDLLSSAEAYSSLARHFAFYLYSGVLSLSEAVRNNISDVGGGPTTVFAPFINLYRVALDPGNFIAAGSAHEKGMTIEAAVNSPGSPNTGDNVYTMFGTLYLYLGACGAIIYVVVLALILYGVLIAIRTRKANEWLLVFHCFLCSQIVVGFFEFYFWNLTIIEVVFYTWIFALLRQPGDKESSYSQRIAAA